MLTFVHLEKRSPKEYYHAGYEKLPGLFIVRLKYLVLFCVLNCECFQESTKTKHPQLHYESKLYMLLQGGSEFFHLCFLLLSCLDPFGLIREFDCILINILQLAYPTWNGLVLKENTVLWLSTFLDLVWKTCLIIVIGSWHWKQFWCLQIS